MHREAPGISDSLETLTCRLYGLLVLEWQSVEWYSVAGGPGRDLCCWTRLLLAEISSRRTACKLPVLSVVDLGKRPLEQIMTNPI